MSKRNLAWILAIVLVAVLFWHMPDTMARRQSFYEVFSALVGIRAEIHKNYVDQVTDQLLLEGAIEGMLQGLDQFSTYVPQAQLEALDRQTSGTFEGIGITLEWRNNIPTVISPMENSPAFRAGIRAGDQILKIDGQPTKDMTFSQTVNSLMGKLGTRVTIEVRREFTGQVEQITVTRDLVKLRTVKGFVRNPDGSWDYILDRAEALAYVRITGFMENTAEELDAAFEQLQQNRVRGLILDLRLNPGGLLPEAVDVVDRFLDHGVIVSTRQRLKSQQIWHATKANTYPYLPMVVLLNQYSASAAEILAGALKDHNRATIVGVRSYGKGSVQSLIRLKDAHGAIKLTTAYYYLPLGRNIHRRDNSEIWGVDPDVELALSADQLVQVQKARQQSEIIHTESYSSRPATMDDQAVTVTLPVPLEIDKQLEKAIEVLLDKLAQQDESHSKSAPELTATKP